MKKNLLLRRLFTMISCFMVIQYLQAQTNQNLDFDKVNDWVKLENGSQYLTNKPGMTIAGWFFDNDLGYGQGMIGFRGTVQNFYMIELANGSIECRFRNSANQLFEYVAPNNTIIPQIWQHFAWVYDGSAVKLYVNGNLKGSKAASGLFTDGTMPFGIGLNTLGSAYPFFWGGRIDEVSAWSKALSQSEIQAMMTNELTGNEAGLEMYYKFNQGVPGGDNTSITKLISKVYSPARDADIVDFAMVGPTSNFEGTLDASYQAISFPSITSKLNNNPPFQVEATATSGLPVTIEVHSGPATMVGNTVTLSGDTGLVVLQATQLGNAQFDPADTVFQSFEVLNPTLHVPAIDPRNPLAGDVYVPTLGKIQLAVISSISYPELFSVNGVKFKINNETIDAVDFQNGHYTAWWAPPSYGGFDIEVLSTNNFGATASKIVHINVVNSTTSSTSIVCTDTWLNPSKNIIYVTGQLPSYLGAYNKISAILRVHCPSGGCETYDRISSIDAQDHEGNWFQVIKYITPYGVGCTHTLDVTDYMSILQGKVNFRINCGSMENGLLYDLSFSYTEGVPLHAYSTVQEVWKGYYPFGDYANLQPVAAFDYFYHPGLVVASKLKLVSTGHGWGSLNTGNAAEFYEATHNILVNGVQKFSQHNWTDCNPNPDACQPQNGTWYYDRAGWCPGSISKPFDFDMTPYIADGAVQLRYQFYDQYIDQCHPHNPNCVTGTTCTDCSDNFNPSLDVACNLINFADSPITTVANQQFTPYTSVIDVFPNPTTGRIDISLNSNTTLGNAMIFIYDNMGRPVLQKEWNSKKTSIDLTGQPKGVYLLKMVSTNRTEVKRVILQ